MPGSRTCQEGKKDREHVVLEMGKEATLSIMTALVQGAAYPAVYICSPYAGDTEGNVQKAIEHSRFAISEGYMAVASHLLYPQILSDADPLQRSLGLAFGIQLMFGCMEVWVFADDDDGISPGMCEEIAIAKNRQMRIRYFTTDHVERGEVDSDVEDEFSAGE